jgi:hypothetical protein
VLLRGYIDESYNDQLFTLSCLMSDPSNWMWFESAWKKCLRFKNKELRKQDRQQLSRYHAADCAALRGEFEGWTIPEQIAFTGDLLKVFDRRFQNVIAYSVPLKDFAREFPQAKKKNLLRDCYGVLLKFLMSEMYDQIKTGREQLAKEHFAMKAVSIALIHDRGPFETALQAAFNHMKNDNTFGGRDYFTTIVPKGWEDCIPLQAADLVAYENFKDSERRLTGRAKQRKPLQLLLTNGSFGGRSRYFSPEAIRQLRTLVEERRKSTTPPVTS